MKAILCKAFGPPSTLVLEEVADPEPGPNQVIVDIKAAGVNFPDLLMVQGLYQFKPPFPFSPGNEVAGTVRSVGSEVTDIEVGARVLATVPWGGFAEQVAVDRAQLISIPENMDFQTASVFVLTYATSQHALVDRAHLKEGETILILGAAGGVGLAAVQLAKASGARVIAAASSDEKLETCKANGADEVINYTQEDLKARAKELTGGEGVDVVYDPVGGDWAERALRTVAWEGRYLVVGFAAGRIPKVPLNLPLLKGCQIVGVFWGSFAARHPERHRAHVEKLFELYDAEKIKPLVSHVYALDRAAEALEDLAKRKVQGKVVLEPAG